MFYFLSIVLPSLTVRGQQMSFCDVETFREETCNKTWQSNFIFYFPSNSIFNGVIFLSTACRVTSSLPECRLDPGAEPPSRSKCLSCEPFHRPRFALLPLFVRCSPPFYWEEQTNNAAMFWQSHCFGFVSSDVFPTIILQKEPAQQRWTEWSQTVQSGEMDYFHLEHKIKWFWIVTVVTQKGKKGDPAGIQFLKHFRINKIIFLHSTLVATYSFIKPSIVNNPENYQKHMQPDKGLHISALFSYILNTGCLYNKWDHV